MKILNIKVIEHDGCTAIAHVTVDADKGTKQEISEICIQVAEYLKKEWLTSNPDKDSIIDTACFVYPFNSEGKPVEFTDLDESDEDT